MDRVYKRSIPETVVALENLKAEFAKVQPSTDWSKLRIEPLLGHARMLDEMLRSRKFSSEIDRLRRGVGMFHADLVYFRENIRGLNKVLESERRSLKRRRG
jgi:hypothetical protein